MEVQERQCVLDQLASSEARLLDIVKGLSPAQWSFRETPERWSIAENIEHLIALEHFVTQQIAHAIQGAAQPDKKSLAPAKESLVLGLARTRTTKMQAREAARPVGRWPDSVELIAELRRTRARTIAFAADTHADLRNHFFPHIAFGDLDCYQWLVALGQHGFRHALQIEDIKAHPAFPAV